MSELKQKIKGSNLFSPTERQEWLYLLPRMTEEQIKELERILSIKLPGLPTGGPATPERPYAGVQRSEVSKGDASRPSGAGRDQISVIRPPTSDLRIPQSETKPVPAPKPIVPRPPMEKPKPWLKPPLARPADAVIIPSKAEPIPLPVPEELKKLRTLDVSDLRRVPSAQAFFTGLRTKISEIKDKGIGSSAEITLAFEQSPLYKAYLESGLKQIEGQEGALLNQKELEALTDFRRSLRKFLNL